MCFSSNKVECLDLPENNKVYKNLNASKKAVRMRTRRKANKKAIRKKSQQMKTYAIANAHVYLC